MVIFFVTSIATRTYLGLIDMSNMIKQRPLLQEEKDRYNSLSLCRYNCKLKYIAIDHKNSALLTTKKQAADTFTSNLMALIPYKPFFIKEKEIFLS